MEHGHSNRTERELPGAAEGKRITIDTACVSGGLYPMGRYFGNGVGIGFDAVVGFFCQRDDPPERFSSYLAAAVKTMNYYHPAPIMEIDLDDETITPSPP
jgi:diacylglycerol kinase family enzyme